MSRSTQEKVKGLLEDEVMGLDLELIDDRNFSNCGTWKVQSKSSLRDKVAIKYSFQHGYCSLEVEGVDEPMKPGVVGSGYIDSDQRLSDVVFRIRKHIRDQRGA